LELGCVVLWAWHILFSELYGFGGQLCENGLYGLVEGANSVELHCICLGGSKLCGTGLHSFGGGKLCRTGLYRFGRGKLCGTVLYRFEGGKLCGT
jgi:hypothetical protein